MSQPCLGYPFRLVALFDGESTLHFFKLVYFSKQMKVEVIQTTEEPEVSSVMRPKLRANQIAINHHQRNGTGTPNRDVEEKESMMELAEYVN